MPKQQTLVPTEAHSSSALTSSPEPVAQPKSLTEWVRWALGGAAKSERKREVTTMTPDGKIVRTEYSKR
jgi:hypothetical protein